MKKVIVPAWLEPYVKQAEYFQHFLALVDGNATEYELSRMDHLLNDGAKSIDSRLDDNYRPNEITRKYLRQLIDTVADFVTVYTTSKPTPLQDELNMLCLGLVTKELAMCIEKTYPRKIVNSKCQAVIEIMGAHPPAKKMSFKEFAKYYLEKTGEEIGASTWQKARKESLSQPS